MPIDKVLKILTSESCSYCSWGCASMTTCKNEQCPLRKAVTDACLYLKKYQREKLIWDEMQKTNTEVNALVKKYHEYVGG